MHQQSLIPTQANFQTVQHLIQAMINHPEELWKSADLAITLIPTAVDELNRSENVEDEINHERKGEILINLTKKIHFTNEEIIRFFVNKIPTSTT